MDKDIWKMARNALNMLSQSEAVQINGKGYLEVRHRVGVFRDVFGGNYSIETFPQFKQFNNTNCVVFKAKICDVATGTTVASGHAMGSEADEFGESFIEVAETKAVGRALANFGLAGDLFPSAEEMRGKGPQKNHQKPKIIVDNTASYDDIIAGIEKATSVEELVQHWNKTKGSLTSMPNQRAGEVDSAFASKMLKLKENHEQQKQ